MALRYRQMKNYMVALMLSQVGGWGGDGGEGNAVHLRKEKAWGRG
jgi:hypothetical protein